MCQTKCDYISRKITLTSGLDFFHYFIIRWFWLRGHSNNTWHSRGGGRQCVTHTFFTSWNTIFKDVGGEKFYFTARLCFKRYFLSYSFHTLEQIRLKIGDQKREKCHTGGGAVRIVTKKCHVLFEWPLSNQMVHWNGEMWSQ